MYGWLQELKASVGNCGDRDRCGGAARWDIQGQGSRPREGLADVDRTTSAGQIKQQDQVIYQVPRIMRVPTSRPRRKKKKKQNITASHCTGHLFKALIILYDVPGSVPPEIVKQSRKAEARPLSRGAKIKAASKAYVVFGFSASWFLAVP